MTRERARRQAPQYSDAAERGNVIEARSRGGLVCLPAHSTRSAPGATATWARRCPGRHVVRARRSPGRRCVQRARRCPAPSGATCRPEPWRARSASHPREGGCNHIPRPPEHAFCAACPRSSPLGLPPPLPLIPFVPSRWPPSPALHVRRDGQAAPSRGTHKTVRARFQPWLSGKSPDNNISCSLFARKQASESNARVEGV